MYFDSPTAASISFMHAKPKLKDLMDKVIPRIGRLWDRVGLQLDIEDYLLAAISSDDHENGGKQMFQQWLNGKKGSGGKPRMWESVLNAIENSIGFVVRNDLEAALRLQN